MELARSGEGLKSGPLGFAVVLVLCVASYFLFKSMSKHLKKVREEFPSELPSPPSGASTPASAGQDAQPSVQPPVTHTAGSDDSSASA